MKNSLFILLLFISCGIEEKTTFISEQESNIAIDSKILSTHCNILQSQSRFDISEATFSNIEKQCNMAGCPRKDLECAIVDINGHLKCVCKEFNDNFQIFFWFCQ